MSWVLVQCLISFWTRVFRRRRNNNFRNQDFEQNGKKFFRHYLELPPELRMMIIDEMQIKDRCRFRRCSKLCNKEARSSKNYYYALEFFCHKEDHIRLFIKYNKKQRNIHKDYTMLVKFKKETKEQFGTWSTTTKFVAFSNFSRNEELWRKKLSKSTDLVEYAAGYFKKLLIENQKYIKYLSLHGDQFKTKLKNYDFGIESLNRLEALSIESHLDVPLYFSKLRRPLNKLLIRGQGNRDILAECEQIYQVQEYVSAPKIKFTNEQFLRMSATSIDTEIGNSTELDIFNFIRTWQNGTIGKERSVYQWMNLRYSNFNIFQLFRLLCKEAFYTAQRGSIEIEHNTEAGIIAKLGYAERFMIRFEWSKRD